MDIEVEDIKTWPYEVHSLILDKFEILANCAAWEIEYPDIPLPKRHYATNPYAGKRYSIIQQINEMISGHNLIGYHCTRLLDSEIDFIRSNGLEPLSEELVKRRIEQAIAENALSRDQANEFLANNQCDQKK